MCGSPPGTGISATLCFQFSLPLPWRNALVPSKRISWAAGLFFFFAIPSTLAQLETRAGIAVLSSPYSIAVGDFNGDGKKDLAVVAFSSDKIAILLGNGDGTFQKATYYESVSSSVATADFRNNGVLDLVVSNDLQNEVQVLLGNGDGTFRRPEIYPTPDYPAIAMV